MSLAQVLGSHTRNTFSVDPLTITVPRKTKRNSFTSYTEKKGLISGSEILDKLDLLWNTDRQ
jgi:hypothetical protein